MADLRNPSVLVSGAGIAGLTAAIGLARLGYRVQVVERADTLRAGGFLVSLSHTAYAAAEDLGLMPHLREFDMGINRSSYHDATGKTLLELDYQQLFSGIQILQIMRDDLVKVLYEQANELSTITFGDQIADICTTSHVNHVTLLSGKEVTVDLVVIAEGQNSQTRQQVFGNETMLDYLDLRCAAFRMPNVLSLTKRFETHMERKRYLAAFDTGHGDLGCVMVWSDPCHVRPANTDRHDILQRMFQDASPATRTVLSQLPPGDQIYMDSLFQVQMPRWHEGRVVAIGDAANCLTLFSGRGAATAVTSAHALTASIAEHGLPAALSAFEALNRLRIGQIQRQTRRAVSLYVPRSAPREWARNNAMRWFPNALFHRYFQRKYRSI